MSAPGMVAPETVVSLPAGELLAMIEQAAERGAARALQAVAELLTADRADADGGAGLVDAQTLARALGVSRAHVYEHAEQLGGVRLGEGPRARLRFDVKAARAALARYRSEQSQTPDASAGAKSARPPARRARSLAARRPQPGSILRSRPRQIGGAA